MKIRSAYGAPRRTGAAALILLCAALPLSGCGAGGATRAVDDPVTGAVARKAPPQDVAASAGFPARRVQARLVASDKAATFRQAVLAALVHDPEVHGARTELARAGTDVALAWTGYQPTLRSSAGIDHEGDQEARLTLSQPLFDWGGTYARVKSSRADRVAARARLSAKREETALKAIEVYAGVKRAEALVAAAKDNLGAYGRIVSLARQRREGGIGDSTDVELGGLRKNEAESELADAQGALDEATTRYVSQVGASPAGLGELPELVLDIDRDNEGRQLVSEAPSVAAARAREAAAAHEVAVQRADLLPRLVAEASLGYEPQSDEEVETTLGLRLTGPTVAGLSGVHRIEAARLDANAARSAVQAMERDVDLEVSVYRDQAPVLRKRMEILGAELKKARALRTLYEDQFILGQRSLSDLLNVQSDIYRISRTRINVRFTLLTLPYRAAGALGLLHRALDLPSPAQS